MNQESMQSESIGELAKALVKAQAALTAAPKEGHNPHFKSTYANLKNVWDACREPLTNNGLSVIQTLDGGDGEVVVVTTLLHESGQWIRGRLPLRPQKSDPQGIGSAISYGKRYSLGAIVGVCAADEDDDAENATDRKATTRQTKRPTPPENNGNGGAQARAERNVEEVFGKHEVNNGASQQQINKIRIKCNRLAISDIELEELANTLAGEPVGLLSKAGASKVIDHLMAKEDEMKSKKEAAIPF